MPVPSAALLGAALGVRFLGYLREGNLNCMIGSGPDHGTSDPPNLIAQTVGEPTRQFRHCRTRINSVNNLSDKFGSQPVLELLSWFSPLSLKLSIVGWWRRLCGGPTRQVRASSM